MNLTKEEVKTILDLYKQLDGLDTPEKIYSIKIPIFYSFTLLF